MKYKKHRMMILIIGRKMQLISVLLLSDWVVCVNVYRKYLRALDCIAEKLYRRLKIIRAAVLHYEIYQS